MAFSLSDQIEINGPFLTVVVVWRGFKRRLHNSLLRRCLAGRPALRVHPSAQIIGTKWMSIGSGFHAGRGLWLEAIDEQNTESFSPNIFIGSNVIVNEDVHIAAINSVRIEDDVLIASRVFIADHSHGIYGGADQSNPSIPPRQRKLGSAGPIVIERNVWIGEMVAILPGVTVGQGSIIGAGSVVTGDIPPQSVAVGAPARVIKSFDSEKEIWVSI